MITLSYIPYYIIKVTRILTPRLLDWPARGKRCMVGLITRSPSCIFDSFFINYFVSRSKINPSLIPWLRSTCIKKGSWRVFFLTRTPPLKFIKSNKDSSVYALYLAAVCPINQAASKETWVTRLIRIHLPQLTNIRQKSNASIKL